jgi:F-type H+-transporting ATPase subunit a
MLASVLSDLSKPPQGFEAPGTEIFDYTRSCLIGNGPYCVTKVTLLMLISSVIIGILFLIAFRRSRVVPRGLQNVLESVVEFIRNGIVIEVMGPDGLPFLPFLSTIFFFVFVNNIFAIIPGIQFPPTSRIAIPGFLAIVVWFVFNIVGMLKQGGLRYLKNELFPRGVPAALYVLMAPVELVSVFILRPLTLALRLAGNMIAGHLMLAVLFLLTWYLQWKPITIPIAAASFALGVFITAFEVLVAVLQAYIFTILTAVYIDEAMHPQH